jgi:hypothetical protein
MEQDGGSSSSISPAVRDQDLFTAATGEHPAAQRPETGNATNLTSSVGQAISSGLYLFTVEDKKNGNVQVGKFVIIK